MKRKSLLFLLLFALIAPWAAQAQTRETLTFNFEDQTIPSTWTNDATYPWVVTNAKNHTNGGAYCIKSSIEGQNSKTSSIEATFNFNDDGTISFYCWASCESASSYWDYGIFYIDGTQMDRFLLVTDWVNKSYNVDAGSHTFKWTYTKDSSVGSNDDCFYVDDIVVALGEVQAYPKPTNLTVTLTEGNGTIADLAWTENGTATAWQICLNGDEDHPIPATTNPWRLTSLTPETTYTAKVRANYGSDQSAWSNEVTFKPTNAVNLLVNDGTANSSYVPIYGLWVDAITKSQFIIPADDLVDVANGTITSMTFYATADKNWGAAQFEVYMAETTETTLSALVDYTTMQKVMNAASLSVVNNEMVVEFDTPFEYTGGNLMIGFLQTVSGTYSGVSWYGVTANGASMGGYNTSISQQNFLPKINFSYLPGEAPTCPKPRGLVAGTPAARSVVLNWTETGEARNWQICLNGDETHLIPANTNEDFLLEGLTPDTDYTIKVRSYCSEDDQSDWSNEVTIHTDVTCPAPTDLTVSDITPFAANVAWSGTASSYNFAVQEPVFFYGFEDAEPWDTINFAPCTTYDGDGAKCYGSGDFDFPHENFHGACIAMQNGVYDDYNDQIFAHSGNAFGGMWDAIPSTIVNGTTTNDWFILPEIAIENGMVFSFWAREIFTNWGPEIINVGAYGTTDGTFASLLAENVEIGNTTWMQYSYDLSAYAGQTIKLAINCVSDDVLAFFFDDIFVGYNYVIDENDIIPNVASPYPLVLEPETTYQVLVQSACGGEDGESAWVYDVFTTPSNCVAPFNLSETDVRATSAILNWEGYQDGFEVRYRIPEHAEASSSAFFDDFENGLGNWTLIVNAEGTGWQQFDATRFSGITNYSGNYVAMTRSYENSVDITADNWMIKTQAMTIPSTMTYFARNDGLDTHLYDETYDVCVSVGSINTSDFVVVQSFTTAPVDWEQITIDLSAYAGQQGYIAFHHHDSAKDLLLIDDVTIGEIVTVPAGDWTYGTTDALFFNTNDNPDSPLIPDTDYEWQVRGENRSCGDEGYTEWSVINTFHTPNECELPTDLYAFNITATSADSLTWTGVQQDFNLRYRTAGFDGYYLFEDFADDDDLLEGWYTVNFDSDYSGLYYEDETYTNIILQMVAALGTTDQYLLGPDMREEAAGNTLTFDYEAISGDYTENFEVGFVATDTVYWDTPVATSDTVWQTYTTVVPEGAVYMVLHYIDGYAILFDNFVCYNADDIVAAGEWIETLEGVNSPVAITGLDPETYYEWQVQGNSDGCTDGVTDWVSSEFKTLESEGQTIALVAGTNWFSTYLEIELADLQNALVDALPGATSITIKSKGGNTRWNGSRWRGTNFTWDVASMYRIEVPEDCEIVLNGDPLNPAEHTITIAAGTSTWIGFPFSESKTFDQAIPAGFAINGDQIKYKDGSARFNGTRWRGTGSFQNLEPGKGYIYVPASSVTTDRILDYSLGTSKAVQTSNLKKEAINMSLTPKTMSKAFNSKSNVQAEQKVTCKKAKKNEDCKSIKK